MASSNASANSSTSILKTTPATTVTSTTLTSTLSVVRTDRFDEDDPFMFIVLGGVAGAVVLIIFTILTIFCVRSFRTRRFNMARYRERRQRSTSSREILEEELQRGLNGVHNNMYNDDHILPVQSHQMSPSPQTTFGDRKISHQHGGPSASGVVELREHTQNPVTITVSEAHLTSASNDKGQLHINEKKTSNAGSKSSACYDPSWIGPDIKEVSKTETNIGEIDTAGKGLLTPNKGPMKPPVSPKKPKVPLSSKSFCSSKIDQLRTHNPRSTSIRSSKSFNTPQDRRIVRRKTDNDFLDEYENCEGLNPARGNLFSSAPRLNIRDNRPLSPPIPINRSPKQSTVAKPLVSASSESSLKPHLLNRPLPNPHPAILQRKPLTPKAERQKQDNPDINMKTKDETKYKNLKDANVPEMHLFPTDFNHPKYINLTLDGKNDLTVGEFNFDLGAVGKDNVKSESNEDGNDDYLEPDVNLHQTKVDEEKQQSYENQETMNRLKKTFEFTSKTMKSEKKPKLKKKRSNSCTPHPNSSRFIIVSDSDDDQIFKRSTDDVYLPMDGTDGTKGLEEDDMYVPMDGQTRGAGEEDGDDYLPMGGNEGATGGDNLEEETLYVPMNLDENLGVDNDYVSPDSQDLMEETLYVPMNVNDELDNDYVPPDESHLKRELSPPAPCENGNYANFTEGCGYQNVFSGT
ncbi:uncharacterized protein LOC128218337 [Mya arenaria]|uniref:uncharacterized protein LOC128218337 n=1 Tax=Mya arenaria TaxID=6604 RepID=UPI0022E7904A|nr:uncharacterized protein LOC128218337 [Mya arenaria]